MTTHHWDISPISFIGGVHSQVRVGKACNSMQSKFTLEVFQDVPCYFLYLNSNLLLHTVTPVPNLTWPRYTWLGQAPPPHSPDPKHHLTLAKLEAPRHMHQAPACVKWLFQQMFFFVNYFIYLHSTFFWEFKCPQLIKLYQSIFFFFSGLANIVKGSNLVSKI